MAHRFEPPREPAAGRHAPGRVRYLTAGLLAGCLAAGLAWGAAPIAEGRRAPMPVVLTGADLPRFGDVAEGSLAAFRWNGSGWERVPLQVDPVRTVDLCQEVDSPDGHDSWPEIPPDADPAVRCTEKRIDFSGELEPDDVFDADDRAVFLIGEAGPARPADAPDPEGAGPAYYEVLLRDAGADPVEEGYLYLYPQADGPAPPGYPLEVATQSGRRALDGLPPECSESDNQFTTIETGGLCAYFATRWSLDDLIPKTSPNEPCASLGAGDAEHPRDVLDRWKGHEGDVGSPVDDDYWGCRSTFADRSSDHPSNGQKTGPVRHVRGVLGAKSGVTTTVYTHVYPDYIEVETRLRVHEMTGIARLLDWSDQVLGDHDAYVELADGTRIEDAIDGSGAPGCETVPGRFNGACVLQDDLRDLGPGADVWSLLSASGGDDPRPFVHTRIASDPRAFTKDPSRDASFKGMQHFYGDFDGPGDDRRLNWELGEDEREGSPGNTGLLFDLRTPYESCMAICDVPEERCRQGPAEVEDDACAFGTYYQPMISEQSFRFVPPEAAGEDPWAVGAEYARLEREPVEITVRYQDGDEECTDADGDGWGQPNLASCPQGPGPDDCDDSDAAIFPGAPEVPSNGRDDDCDGSVDEAGKVTDSVGAGWSFLGVPLDLPQMASEICAAIEEDGGAPERVARWGGASWTTHQCGVPVADFEVLPGDAFFVQAVEPSLWERTGDLLPQPFGIALSAGWNAVCLPSWASARRASDVCDEITAAGGDPRRVVQWTGDAWSSHHCGVPVADFAVPIGKGLFVLTDGSAVWSIEN